MSDTPQLESDADTTAEATVVVGVDGSEGSFEALIWATHHAQRAKLALLIVTVTEIPAIYTPLGAPALPPGSTFDDLERQGMDVNARAVADAEAFDLGIQVFGTAVIGTPVAALLEATKPGDMLVVSATSHHGRLTDLLGSVATGVVHRAHGPIVVVHGAVPHDAPLNRIVVGIDGWDESRIALEWACDTAALTSGMIEVVHAWEYPYRTHESVPGAPREEMQRDAQALVDSMVNELSNDRRKFVTGKVVVEGAAAEVLIDASADADLLVVGSRGQGGLRSWLLGSVSRKVVHHASRPVAVIPSHQERAQ